MFWIKFRDIGSGECSVIINWMNIREQKNSHHSFFRERSFSSEILNESVLSVRVESSRLQNKQAPQGGLYLKKARSKCQDWVQNSLRRVQKAKKPITQVNPSTLCLICQLPCPTQDLQSISFSCSHLFCPQCLISHATARIQANQNVTCPQQNCASTLAVGSIIFRRLQPRVQEIHRNKVKESRMKSSERVCPNEKCDGVISCDLIENQILIKCSKCSQEYCGRCLSAPHSGECDQNNILRLSASLDYRQCNLCRRVIQKAQGCNHIKCQCGHQFCYLCGEAWKEGHICFNTPNCCFENKAVWIICKISYLLAYCLLHPLILVGFILALAIMVMFCCLLGVLIGPCCILSTLHEEESKFFWVAVILYPVLILPGVYLITSQTLKQVITSELLMRVFLGPCFSAGVCWGEITRRQ